MRRKPSRRVLLFTVLGLVLVGGLWVAWQGWNVARDLNAAVDDVDALRAAAESGDTAGMERALDSLDANSRSADDRTSGPTWSVLTRVPWVGDDARGVRVVSDVVHGIAVDGARPLVEVSQDLDQITPRDARVSVDAIVALQDPVDRAEAALAAAETALAAEDPTKFVMRLRTEYRDLTATVRDAHRALSSASTAVQVMPSMLGGDGDRNYLLVFQNNAEIRATGGLPGAVTLVNARDGQVALTRQVAANSFPAPDQPVLPLSEAEDFLYTDLLGRYFLDANFTPDFPRASDLMRTHWENEYAERIDGVLSIDPVALSYVLAVTGPIKAAGVTLTADNIVDELLHQVYLREEDPAAQDEFFRAVASAAFDQVFAGADDPEGLLRALARGADESRIYVHSFDEQEQSELSGHKVAGELVKTTTERPQVTVALNDSTGAKMSYFLRYDVKVNATYCTDGVQGYTASAVLQSAAPANAASLPDYITGAGLNGADPGTQFVNVQIYGPFGGSVSDLRVNADEIESAVVDQDGRPADTLAVQLDPGQKVRLSWRMTSGPGQAGGTDVSVTPGIEAREYSSRVPSAC